MKVRVGQVRLVRDDAKLHAGALLQIGDKIVIKEVEDAGSLEPIIVTFCNQAGVKLHTTYTWMENNTDVI